MKPTLVWPTRLHWAIIIPLAFFIAAPFVAFTLAARFHRERVRARAVQPRLSAEETPRR